MHSGIERRSERRAKGCTPARPYGKDLDGAVGVAVLVQAGKGHDCSVAQVGNRRIPAAVCHVLSVRELASRRIIYGAAQLSVERVVLQRTAIDEGAAISENYHAVAEHVPANRLGGYRPGRGVENGGAVVRLSRQ